MGLDHSSFSSKVGFRYDGVERKWAQYVFPTTGIVILAFERELLFRIPDVGKQRHKTFELRGCAMAMKRRSPTKPFVHRAPPVDDIGLGYPRSETDINKRGSLAAEQQIELP